jgi:pilus assembly protein Flp/PilA
MLTSVFNSVKAFLANEDGPTALEYAVMIALIILACILGITAFGNAVAAWFTGATPTVEALRTAPGS